MNLHGSSALISRWLRVHLIAVSLLALLLITYTLVGFFLVPRIARHQIESFVTDTLHRQIRIGDIRFNPFVFDASVEALALNEATGAPLVSFQHLYVNVQLASLWRRALVLDEVELSAPDINVLVDKDGGVNLARLKPPSTDEPSETPRVRIGRLQVRDGRLKLTDYTHVQPFTATLAPIRFALNDFRTDAGYENAYQFAAKTAAGESLQWSGEFTVQPLGSNGRFRVQDLRALTVDELIAESSPTQLMTGVLSLDGNYRLTLNPKLSLNLALPTVQIRDLSLRPRNSTIDAPVRVAALDINGTEFSYAQRRLAAKLIEIKGAHVDAVRAADQSINLTAFAGADAEPALTNTAASTAPAPPVRSDWSVTAETIRLLDSTIAGEDQTVQPSARFDIAPIQITVTDWSADPTHPMKIDAEVGLNSTARIAANGELKLSPLSTQLEIDTSRLALAPFQSYIQQVAAMTVHSGELNARGQLSFASRDDDKLPITFKGAVRLDDLKTTDQLVNEDFIKWRQLAIEGIDLSTRRLDIERVVAREPYARVVIAPDQSLNVAKVLHGGDTAEQTANASAEKTKTTKKSSALPVRIKAVQFVDASANFADYSIEPSFATGILQLNGSVVGLSSDPKSRAKVKLQGKVDKYAPVEITGDLNVLAAAKFTDLGMSFRNMELTTFNPYSGKFAGYNISKGKLSTDLHYTVNDRKLDASHHIVLDNLEFGDKTDSKDAAPIPLKLAVALLKDRQGIIDVNLPVSGTLDDPKFRLGPIIWKAFVGLLTKIVTAPFAALGAIFGGGDELAFVDFPAGSSTLDATQAAKLNTLSKALVERPQLRLSVPLTVADKRDSEALALAAMMAKLPEDARAAPTDEKSKKARLALLEKAYLDVAGHKPEFPNGLTTEVEGVLDEQLKFVNEQLIAKLHPDENQLNGLARDRARAVQDALLSNADLNPEHVFITAERSEGKTEGEQIRMEMKLE